MRNLLSPRILCFTFLSMLLIGVYAQESIENTENPELDRLLVLSLNLSAKGEWEKALQALDDAKTIDSAEPRIETYRASIIDLMALDKAQNAWNKGQPSMIENETQNSKDEIIDDNTPKFVIEREESIRQDDISQYRDQFRGELSFNLASYDSTADKLVSTWSSLESFVYSSLGVKVRYWFPFLGRSFGVNFRSSGYSWSPSDLSEPTILFNSLDLGINLRGFLIEEEQSHLELGLDFGGSLHSLKTLSTQQVGYSGMLYLGLWVSDPVFYHLLKVKSLENLVFGGGIRVYSSIGEELLETVYYRVDGTWRFEFFHIGMRFEWWGFTDSGRHYNPLSLTLYSGIQF